MWRRGSYEVAGDWFAAASRAVLDGPQGSLAGPGVSVLDVACGTGAVAIEAARRGARIVGIDLTSELLEVARLRAQRAQLTGRFLAGTFTDLRAAVAGEFDLVASAFGVMFAADPVAVAAQLAAVCRPAGVISVAAWDGAGAFGAPPEELIALLPSRGVDYTRWSSPDAVGGFFAATPFTVSHHRAGEVAIPFASVPAAAEAMLTYSGPWIMIFEHLAATGAAERGRELLEAHLAERSAPHPDGIALRARYGVVQLSTR